MSSREKAIALLAGLIEAAGGSFNGKTRLYKAFYVAHLLHFRDHQGVLSDYPIVRMPRGPAIDAGDALLLELEKRGSVFRTQRPVGPYSEDVYGLRKPVGGLATDEMESVRRAVEWIGNKTAAELSEWTHEFSNTWEDTPDGHPMNIYADLLSEAEYHQMKERHKSAKGIVDAVFAG